MAYPYDTDPFGNPVNPYGQVPSWTGPVPLPPEWGQLDQPQQEPDQQAALVDAIKQATEGQPTEGQPIEGQPVDPYGAQPVDPYGLQPGIPIPSETLDRALQPAEAPQAAPYDAQPLNVQPQIEAAPESEVEAARAFELSKNPLDVAAAEYDQLARRRERERSLKEQLFLDDARESEAQRKRLTDAQEDTKRELAEIDAEGKKIADEKQGLEGMSTGKRIAGVIAAVIGGLIQGKTGSARNMGLDMINGWIEKDLAEHKQRVANIGQRRKDALSADPWADYKQTEILRQSKYEQVARSIENEMANFDPKGSRHIELAKMAGQMRAQAQASGEKFAAEDFRRKLELWDRDLKERTFLEAARHNKATEIRASAGGGAAKIEAPEAVFGLVYPSLNDVPEKARRHTFRLPDRDGEPGGFIVAANEENAKHGTELVGMYNSANYDLNQLQKIALERDNAKSVGGQVWKRWQTTGEKRYDQLMLDYANVYGMMIHGSSPTGQVLHEVLGAMPELKGIAGGVDTERAINGMRDDLDNRLSLRLQTLGSNDPITSSRPAIDEPASPEILAPLVAPPVKGAAGYATTKSFVRDFMSDVKRLEEEHRRTGNSDLANEDLAGVLKAQQSAASQIRADLSGLEKLPIRTPEQDAEYKRGKRALYDRVEAARQLQQYIDEELKRERERADDEKRRSEKAAKSAERKVYRR